MLYSDGESVFAKNYVKDTKVATILSDLEDVKALAVDANRGYLFIATQPKYDLSEVHKYKFTVNATNTSHPFITVNTTSKL